MTHVTMDYETHADKMICYATIRRTSLINRTHTMMLHSGVGKGTASCPRSCVGV